MLVSEVGFGFGFAAVTGPFRWCGVPVHIPDIELCAVFDEQTDQIEVALACGFMQGSGVSVCAGRVVTIRIFSGGEQRAHYLDLAVLRGEREGEATLFRVRFGKEVVEFLASAQRSEDGQIQGGTQAQECLNGGELAV